MFPASVATLLAPLVNVKEPAPFSSRPPAVIVPACVTAPPASSVRLPVPTLALPAAIAKPAADLTEALLPPAVRMVRLVVATSMPSVAPIAPTPAPPCPVRFTFVAVMVLVPVSSIDLAARFTVPVPAATAPVTVSGLAAALFSVKICPVTVDAPSLDTLFACVPRLVAPAALVIVNVSTTTACDCVMPPPAVRLKVPLAPGVPTVTPLVASTAPISSPLASL